MWKSEFMFKDLLVDEDIPPAKAQELGEEIVDRLKRSAAFAPTTRRQLMAVFARVNNQDGFNDALEKLYDLADEERVWLGLRHDRVDHEP